MKTRIYIVSEWWEYEPDETLLITTDKKEVDKILQKWIKENKPDKYSPQGIASGSHHIGYTVYEGEKNLVAINDSLFDEDLENERLCGIESKKSRDKEYKKYLKLKERFENEGD